jgi:hypothetical protein
MLHSWPSGSGTAAAAANLCNVFLYILGMFLKAFIYGMSRAMIRVQLKLEVAVIRVSFF